MRRINQLALAPFDASDYLDSEETIAEYLSAALGNPDPDTFLVAVRDVAKARGYLYSRGKCRSWPGELIQGVKTGGTTTL